MAREVPSIGIDTEEGRHLVTREKTVAWMCIVQCLGPCDQRDPPKREGGAEGKTWPPSLLALEMECLHGEWK